FARRRGRRRPRFAAAAPASSRDADARRRAQREPRSARRARARILAASLRRRAECWASLAPPWPCRGRPPRRRPPPRLSLAVLRRAEGSIVPAHEGPPDEEREEQIDQLERDRLRVATRREPGAGRRGERPHHLDVGRSHEAE